MRGNLTHRTKDMLPLIESSTYLGFRFSEEIKKDLLKQIFKILVFEGTLSTYGNASKKNLCLFFKKNSIMKKKDFAKRNNYKLYFPFFDNFYLYYQQKSEPSPLSFIPADSSFNLNKKSVVKKKKIPIIKLQLPIFHMLVS